MRIDVGDALVPAGSSVLPASTLALLLALTIGCGSAPPGPPPTPPPASMTPPEPVPAPAAVDTDDYGPFPSQTDLAALANTPLAAPGPTAPAQLDPVDLVGPFPDRFGDARLGPNDDPFDQLLGRASDHLPGVVQTVGLNCVAREVGHHMARTGRQADEPLKRFIAQACGVSTTNMATLGRAGPAKKGWTARKIYRKWKKDLRTLAGTRLFSGPYQVGGWLGVVDDRAVAVMVGAAHTMDLDPSPRQANASGEIRLTGALHDPAVRLVVQVTHGPFGVAQCAVDPEVKLPRFVVDCPLDAGDATATISFGRFEEGRLMGQMAGVVQAWPRADRPTRYAPVIEGTPLPADVAAWGPTLVEAINGRRTALGLESVAHDPAESAGITGLVAPFDAAITGRLDPREADQVAMGVMAGWAVQGHVLEGAFAHGMIDGPATVERALADILWLPDGRQALFDVRATRLAIGAARLGGERAGMLVGAYRTLEEGWRFDLAIADANEVLEALTLARAALDKPAPERLTVVEQSHIPMVGSELRGDKVQTALGALMATTGQQTGARPAGAALRTTRLDVLSFPPEVLEADRLAIIVGYGTTEAGPWPPRVILLSWAAAPAL